MNLTGADADAIMSSIQGLLPPLQPAGSCLGSLPNFRICHTVPSSSVPIPLSLSFAPRPKDTLSDVIHLFVPRTNEIEILSIDPQSQAPPSSTHTIRIDYDSITTVDTTLSSSSSSNRTKRLRKQSPHQKIHKGVTAFAACHAPLTFAAARGPQTPSPIPAGNATVLNYVSAHDNKVIRSFPGQTGCITTIAVSPVSDMMLTYDPTAAKLWDLRSSANAAKCDLPSPAKGSCAWDPSGAVFALARNGVDGAFAVIKLYSTTEFTEAFSTFKVQSSDIIKKLIDKRLDANAAVGLTRKAASWTGPALEFDSTGARILLKCGSSLLLLLDAFDGTLIDVLCEHLRLTGNGGDAEGGMDGGADGPDVLRPPQSGAACFAPDGNHIFAGTNDGRIAIYGKKETSGKNDAEKDAVPFKMQHTWKGHAGPIRGVVCCPNYKIAASVCTTTCMWMEDENPSQDDINDDHDGGDVDANNDNNTSE